MKVDRVDFAIITILPEEYDAIYTRFNPEPYTAPTSRNRYGISRIQTREGKECIVAITRTPRSGNDASQQLANNIIRDLDPQVLLVVGIGGGVPDNDFTLGDVIVSSYIYNFDVNAVKGNKTTYEVTGGIHPIISDITANLYLYRNQLSSWNNASSISMPRPSLHLQEEILPVGLIDKDIKDAWKVKVTDALQWHFDKQQRGARDPKFLTASIASSNTLVRSDTILNKWLEEARGIRAVEMEVAGVYQAAQRTQQQYPVMAIRGISDIVGFKRNDEWKLYACHTAAAFAHAFVTSGIVEPREDTSSSTQSSLSSEGSTAMPPHNHATSDSQSANTIKIFTIYADADRGHQKNLYTHLSPYRWNGMIDLWDKTRIDPNPNLMQQEIEKHIDTSQIILLLISTNFPSDSQCIKDMKRAMQRRVDRSTTIIPIYVRPTDWPKAPFDGLLQLPRNEKPISEWSNLDSAWNYVAKDIRKACEAILGLQSEP